ncbi:MAG: phosphatidylserine decarboxylase [Propionibacteriaceae bacterium]|jgi:phosphatidylserine decarboxylase|nr:phosphatidylserine decarboxylase [Propionibacteriaceae bacterium]
MANKLVNGAPQSAFAHVAEMVKTAIPPLHPAGKPFVVGGLALAALGLRVPVLRRLGLGFAAASAAFFRNPTRVTPGDPAAVVAVSDGEICAVDFAVPPSEAGLGERAMRRISTFLSITDVHVQRAPLAATVAVVTHVPGQFLSADLPETSEVNERNTVVFEAADGTKVAAVQVAGMVARRIVCDVTPGNPVAAGEVYGLIRFGSRVDLYLPEDAEPQVAVGQRAVGGETVLARLP